MGHPSCPTSRYLHALPGGGRLSKIAHLMLIALCRIHTAKWRSNAGPPSSVASIELWTALLQQPRHQLIQPSFRLDENILFLDFLDVLPAKLDSWKFTRCLRAPPCIVKVSRLVFPSPPAIRAQHGKLSRHAQRAMHRNFASARRTAHATHAHVGFDSFSKHCHGGLLSGFGGLSGCPLHYFYEAPQFLVDLAKPICGIFHRIGATFVRARHLLVPDVRREGFGEQCLIAVANRIGCGVV